MPTRDTELKHLRTVIGETIVGEQYCFDNITPLLIKKCAEKLKAGKDDGKYGLKSDFIINGSMKLFSMICSLFKCMLSHGFNPPDLLYSCIVSIPKDAKGSLNTSDNYRGISLINPICKLFDYAIIELHGKQLRTSDMQFGFKEKHSTVMCSVVYMEVVDHYLKGGSDVYSCLLDASKAFDRVHFGKLFTILFEKGLPSCIIRILYDSYLRQYTCAMWGDHISKFFNVSNGVKQGGVLSPILFTLYIDKLLMKLRRIGSGCHINGTFVGVLSYADDLTLLNPSIRGLNKMLRVCSQFGEEFDLKFNCKKSMGIKFGGSLETNETISLGNEPIAWVEEVRHLGNFINNKLSDKVDCDVKYSSFIGSVNKLLSNFAGIDPIVVAKLFKSYCCSYYGSCIWYINSKGFNKICTAWNIAIRRMFGLHYETHRWILGPLLGQLHISDQLHTRNVRFLFNLKTCNNVIVNTCYHNAVHNTSSLIGAKMQFFTFHYGISIRNHSLSYCVKTIRKMSTLTESCQSVVCNLKTLIGTRHQRELIPGFNTDEIDILIDHLSIS